MHRPLRVLHLRHIHLVILVSLFGTVQNQRNTDAYVLRIKNQIKRHMLRYLIDRQYLRARLLSVSY